VWLGLLSQEWSDPENWNCEAVPGAADNATVTGAGTHIPVITSTVSLAKLDIDPGNSLTLQGGIVEYRGDQDRRVLDCQ